MRDGLKYKVYWYNPVQKENQLVATFKHQGDAWLYCNTLYEMAKKDHKSMQIMLYQDQHMAENYFKHSLIKEWRL